MTLFILEYQAQNTGECTMTPPLAYTNELACLSAFYSKCASAVTSQSCDTHTLVITDSEGNVWQGYKQIIRHGQE